MGLTPWLLVAGMRGAVAAGAYAAARAARSARDLLPALGPAHGRTPAPFVARPTAGRFGRALAFVAAVALAGCAGRGAPSVPEA
ncbi:MAG TPA: hypothetical protein VMK65_13175, partial [Longimicrobiales bacterium]|nr:hypothetical protein [Longimicrobiales bacterium]